MIGLRHVLIPAVFLSLLAATLPVGRAAESVRTDFYGDPLPPGALARMGSVRLRPGERCSQILFSADGKELISLASDGAIRFWDPETGKQLRTLTVEGRGFEQPAVSPDGKTLAACGGEWSARHLDPSPSDWLYLWDAKTHAQRTAVRVEGMGVRCLAFSPDGKTLATGGRDKIIRLWDADSGKERRKLEGHEWSVIFVAFSPDGSLLGAGDPGFGFQMWDMATGKPCWKAGLSLQGPICDFRFLPDGKGLGIWSSQLRVLNTTNGKELRVIEMKYPAPDRPFVLSADGKTLIGCTHLPDRSYRIGMLSLDGQGESEFLGGNSRMVTRMALSPDGKTLATVAWPSMFHTSTDFISFYDLTAKRKRDVLPGHIGGVATSFLPDGKTLITWGGDGTTRFWDGASGKELRKFGGEKDPVSLLAPTKDGAVFALRFSKGEDHDADHLIHILDALTGQVLRPLEAQGPEKGRRPTVRMWILSPDGKTLVFLASKLALNCSCSVC